VRAWALWLSYFLAGSARPAVCFLGSPRRGLKQRPRDPTFEEANAGKLKLTRPNHP